MKHDQHDQQLQILRKMRERREHNFTEMCSSVGISEAAYRKKMLDGRLDEVIDAYRRVPDSSGVKVGFGGMTSLEIARSISHPKLPPVGAVLENGDAKVEVIRHTGADSILVEWTDAERKIRRAEWTTRPHPRQTDRGVWETKR